MDTGVALAAVAAMEAASVEVSAATSAALPAAVTPSVAAMEKDLGGVMASAAVISGDSLLSATPSTMTHVGGARAIIDASAHNEKPACAPRGQARFWRDCQATCDSRQTPNYASAGRGAQKHWVGGGGITSF